MKVVTLAGGFGTRLSEETEIKPKPMLEIGGRPILWHIMTIFSHFGFNDFIICLGYKGYVIKEYFANDFLHHCGITFDFTDSSNRIIHNRRTEPWKVTLVDTGQNTMTGGRVKRIQPYVNHEPFMLTYGDGLGSIAVDRLVDFHRTHVKLATVTAVQPSGRFGSLNLNENDRVTAFQEKPKGDGAWINGGFFVLEPGIFDFIDGDDTIWERGPLENLAASGNLVAFKHDGFWKPMDTLRDKKELEALWESGTPPWKIWHDPDCASC